MTKKPPPLTPQQFDDFMNSFVRGALQECWPAVKALPKEIAPTGSPAEAMLLSLGMKTTGGWHVTCGTSSCCNPAHLQLGWSFEKQMEMYAAAGLGAVQPDCLIWQGHFRDGVPVMSDGRKYVSVAIAAWRKAGKECSERERFRRSCGSPDCVNVAHLVSLTTEKRKTAKAKAWEKEQRRAPLVLYSSEEEAVAAIKAEFDAAKASGKL